MELKNALHCSLVWLLAVVIAVTAAVYISLSTWNRYLENPSVVSMERNYQEWNTTLPALTLCFQNKIDYENFDSPYLNEYVVFYLKHISNKVM